MLPDLLNRKQTRFVLWRPGRTDPTPTLYIGTQPHGTDKFENFREIQLQQSPQFPELWEVLAQDCGLIEGQVYFYWFKVGDAEAHDSASKILYCTDPTAWTIDRRLPAPVPPDSGGVASFQPVSVILYQNGKLIPSDPEGRTGNWDGDTSEVPTNNHLVIYELPTAWAAIGSNGQVQIGVGTFRDVLALLVAEAHAPSFPGVTALNNRAHLLELGVTALELLPPADSGGGKEEWGYGTANYFAAEHYYGLPDGQSTPTASTDLVNLIRTCHQNGLRFFVDVVMAFSRNQPYHYINFLDFYIKWGSGDPEQGNRDAFGGDLFKYNYWVEGYHPITGQQSRFVPAREYLKAYIAHWITYYRVDGLRLDSINNIANYDFLQEFKEFARSLWAERGGTSDRFLVVGEELSVPLELVYQNRLDGLWNEKFKQIVRQVILGHSWADDSSFEWSVRKLIDCRNLGFTDGSQAINYITSHDIGGLGNERLFNWLVNNGVYNTEPRIKLAFVCLLTAVGVPMILAGDEFADQTDLDISFSPDRDRNKQIDPVNYSRMKDDWRRRIFNYVSRLVRFRTQADALIVNDTQFIHVDFNEGKRVVVWQRGNKPNSLVVVVANFSDYGTPGTPHSTAEYVVPHWPATPPGKQWREITQDRTVAAEWVGREPIFPWEAKVYALV